MAQTTKVQLKLSLTDGKKTVINLPAPVNNTLTDPTTHNTIWDETFAPIKAVYQADNGAEIFSMGYHIITTVDTEIAGDDFDGTI